MYRVIASRTDGAIWILDRGRRPALGRRLRRPSRTGGPASSFPLPQVVVWRGLRRRPRAKASWPAADKLPPHLDDLLGPGWVAVAGAPVPGVEGIAATGRLTLSLRTAVRIGRRGWIGAPDELALEELVTVDDACWTRPWTRAGAILRRRPDGSRADRDPRGLRRERAEHARDRPAAAPRAADLAYRLERIARLIGLPWTAGRSGGCPSPRSPTARAEGADSRGPEWCGGGGRRSAARPVVAEG